MANGKDTSGCTFTSWLVAAVAGVVLFALLMVLGDWRFIQAAFAGVIAALILGFLLSQFICPEGTAKQDLEAVRKGEKGAGAATASAAAAVAATSAAAASSASTAGTAGASSSAGAASAGTSAAAASAGGAATTSGGFEMKPSKALPGEAELASRKGEWKYEAEPAPAKKAPAKKAPAKKAAPKKAASDTAASKPKRAPVAADGKPETLTAARAEGPDDLKLISGVGPKLEGMLNSMGFWHFDQIAGWRKREVQWVNDNLEGFKGRIERDDWVSQAKILAKGGETEFSKKKKK